MRYFSVLKFIPQSVLKLCLILSEVRTDHHGDREILSRIKSIFNMKISLTYIPRIKEQINKLHTENMYAREIRCFFSIMAINFLVSVTYSYVG